MKKNWLLLFLFFLSSPVIWAQTAEISQKITITPSAPITLRVGGVYGDYNSGGWMQFRILVNGEIRDGIADWTINSSPTGDASMGFLMNYEGDYLTPAKLPVSPFVTLRATKKNDISNYDEIVIRLVSIPRSYRILVDLSHSFLFSWHNASFHFQFGQPFRVTASLQRSLKPELLENYDAVIIPNGHTDVPFLDYEISAVKNFVNQGGGLLLVNENGNGQAPVDEMNRLAKQFSLCFGEPIPGPYILSDNSIIENAPLSIDSAVRVSNFRQITGNVGKTEVLATNIYGLPIAMAKNFGAGRIAAIGDIDIVSNQQNRLFVLALTEWLSQNMTAKTDTPILFDAGCDNRLSLKILEPATEICIADSLLGYYPPALNLLIEKIPEVLEIETKLLGYGFPRKKISVDMITSGGFSFVDGDEVAHAGVALIKEPLVDNVGIFAHEILGPWHYPRTVVQPIGEAISMWHSEETFIQMGGEYAASGQATRQWHLNNFYYGDPSYVKFDIARDFLKNTPTAFGKVHWIFDFLRIYLGDNFFRNYWRTIQTSLTPSWQALSIDEFIFWMSVANEVNLFPFFKKIGTTVHPENFPVIPFPELKFKNPKKRWGQR